MDDKQKTDLAFEADTRWNALKNPPAFILRPTGMLWVFAVVAKEVRKDHWSLIIFDEEGVFVTNIATAILESNKR